MEQVFLQQEETPQVHFTLRSTNVQMEEEKPPYQDSGVEEAISTGKLKQVLAKWTEVCEQSSAVEYLYRKTGLMFTVWQRIRSEPGERPAFKAKS